MNIQEMISKAYELYYKNDLYGALSLYYKVLAEDLNNSLCYYNVGLIYDSLREYELAVSYYKKSISLDSKNVRSINNLARIYIDEIKDYDIAQIYLNHAIEVAPNDAEAYNLFGNLWLIKNDCKLALRYFEKSISYDEKYFKNYYDIALAYYALNDNENALKNVQKSLELNPDFTNAQEFLQQIL